MGCPPRDLRPAPRGGAPAASRQDEHAERDGAKSSWRDWEAGSFPRAGETSIPGGEISGLSGGAGPLSCQCVPPWPLPRDLSRLSPRSQLVPEPLQGSKMVWDKQVIGPNFAFSSQRPTLKPWRISPKPHSHRGRPISSADGPRRLQPPAKTHPITSRAGEAPSPPQNRGLFFFFIRGKSSRKGCKA